MPDDASFWGETSVGSGNESDTSIWQLTLPQRNNAATIIQHTTVKPFIFVGSSFRCFYCYQYYPELRKLFAHTNLHEIPERKCLLQKHIHKGKRAIQVDISKLNCRVCNIECSNLGVIKEHLILEHGIEFFPTDIGMTEFNMEPKDGMFKCQMCPEEFCEFRLLNTHMNTHLRKVVCETCGESFINQHLYLKHKETHKGDSFICKYCDKVFYKKRLFQYHMRIIHGGVERTKESQCSHCPRTFKEYYSKIKHMKEVHRISKSFQCHICKMKFDMRRTLTEHITKDHTEKYKCEVCYKCFTVESRLTQHMLGHSNEKKFICAVCNKSYVHKKSLKKHLKTHDAPSTPYKIVCAMCGTAFCKKNDYTKHMKLWHFFGEAEEYESDENLFFQL